ncbi:MAG: OmpA family protein [Phycisphaerales bacterium]
MRRQTLAVTFLTAAAGLPLVGCNSKYNDLEAAYRASEARNQELVNENESLRANLDQMSGRLGQSDDAMGGALATNAELRGRLLRLQEDYRNLEDRLRNLDFGQVNPETDQALRNLAAQHPDLIQYDSKRGMLRFASDLTFASGSAEVRSEAANTLSQLARVLNNPTAAEYDVQIVGHTDSVPVSSGTAQRHPSNTHLSAHRAISVRDALANSGVSRSRMQVAGWGEFRPAVPNNAGRAGTAQNRRVEIFLIPSTADMYLDSPVSSPETQRQQTNAPTQTREIDPIK